MYYSGFGILIVILHLIINYDVLRKGRDKSDLPHYRYRQFLNALLVFYVTDLLWGFLVDLGNRTLAFADTEVFFFMMALSVFLWTRYVVAFVDKKGTRSNMFLGGGWSILLFALILLIINIFRPILFTFTADTQYYALPGRHILLVLQLLLFISISIYSFFVSRKATGRDRVHYMAVAVSGGVMTVLIVIQSFFPFAPFYTIGCFIANCVLNVFVEEDEKREQDLFTERAMKEKEIYSHIAEGLAREYEAIYYVDIESGEYNEISTSGEYRSMNVPSFGKDFYEETRANVRRFVHPDDRDFALGMYYKDVMLGHLKKRNSYSYRYRVMVGDEARIFRFDVMLSEDADHFIICNKDIHDTITSETENQKKSVTFTQIAESLASNYDVIYYIDINTEEYTSFTSNNIYGELQIAASGHSFFAEVAENVDALIHPSDRQKVLSHMDKDYLLSALEDRKQVDIQYRLIVDDKNQHTRLSARKSSDGQHIILGVENIDDEIRKEKEHLKALNTEKELARRDELTGTRNKTALIELESSIQENINNGMTYLPFAFALCDLNNLKKVNDSQGHKAGDEYIVSAAKLLCDIFDHSPVFRIGGDEFVIFLRGDDYNARDELIDRLKKTSLANRESGSGPIIAAGLAVYDPESDSSVTDVLDRADHMMYKDKRSLKRKS